MKTLVASPVVLVVAGILFLVLAWRIARAVVRARWVRPGTWIDVELAGAVGEVATPRGRWTRWLPRPPRPEHLSVAGFRRVAERAGRDPRVRGVLLRVGALGAGWATVQGLRDVVAKLRAADKRVVVYLREGGETREIFLAAAADRILVAPQAGLAPLGVKSATTFYRSLLARGGVEAEVVFRKEFKSAVEPFTLDAHSEAHRLQNGALLDAVHAAVVRALVEGRGMTDDEARGVIDRGPYRPRDAVALKLVDGLAYDDELLGLLGAAKGGLVKLARYRAATEPRWWQRRRGRRVGVVEVRGPIVSGVQMALGRIADAGRVIGALRAARQNEGIGAVVLLVNSPGGSALASDLIAREVARLREKKPVVAYFSDVAASGGYYVAAPANEIVAQPLSVTGSIGVFMMRFVFERALEKLGLSHEVMRRGERADIMSPYRHWSEAERAVLDREVDGFYTDFVDIVARGRNRAPDAIEPLARGRVYAAVEAHRLGLVDSLGGLDHAVARAAALGKLVDPPEPVMVLPPRELPEPPEPPTALQPLIARMGRGVDLVNLCLNADRERLFAYLELDD